MSIKIMTKPNSLHDYTIYPDVGDTVTFSGGWHNATSDPVPYARIDAYMSPDRGPQIITWLAPEHYKQVNDFILRGLRTDPTAVFEASTGGYFIPVSTIPEEIYDETL